MQVLAVRSQTRASVTRVGGYDGGESEGSVLTTAVGALDFLPFHRQSMSRPGLITVPAVTYGLVCFLET